MVLKTAVDTDVIWSRTPGVASSHLFAEFIPSLTGVAESDHDTLLSYK